MLTWIKQSSSKSSADNKSFKRISKLICLIINLLSTLGIFERYLLRILETSTVIVLFIEDPETGFYSLRIIQDFILLTMQNGNTQIKGQ